MFYWSVLAFFISVFVIKIYLGQLLPLFLFISGRHLILSWGTRDKVNRVAEPEYFAQYWQQKYLVFLVYEAFVTTKNKCGTFNKQNEGLASNNVYLGSQSTCTSFESSNFRCDFKQAFTSGFVVLTERDWTLVFCFIHVSKVFPEGGSRIPRKLGIFESIYSILMMSVDTRDSIWNS